MVELFSSSSGPLSFLECPLFTVDTLSKTPSLKPKELGAQISPQLKQRSFTSSLNDLLTTRNFSLHWGQSINMFQSLVNLILLIFFISIIVSSKF